MYIWLLVAILALMPPLEAFVFFSVSLCRMYVLILKKKDPFHFCCFDDTLLFHEFSFSIHELKVWYYLWLCKFGSHQQKTMLHSHDKFGVRNSTLTYFVRRKSSLDSRFWVTPPLEWSNNRWQFGYTLFTINLFLSWRRWLSLSQK